MLPDALPEYGLNSAQAVTFSILILVMILLVMGMCVFFKARSSNDSEKQAEANNTKTNGSVAVTMSPDPRSSVDLIETSSLSQYSVASCHQNGLPAIPTSQFSSLADTGRGETSGAGQRCNTMRDSYESLPDEEGTSETPAQDTGIDEEDELYSRIEGDGATSAPVKSRDIVSIRSTTGLLAGEESMGQSSAAATVTDKHVYAVVNKSKRTSKIENEAAADESAETSFSTAAAETAATTAADIAGSADAGVGEKNATNGSAFGPTRTGSGEGTSKDKRADSVDLHVYSVVDKNRANKNTNQSAESDVTTVLPNDVTASSSDAITVFDGATVSSRDAISSDVVHYNETAASAADGDSNSVTNQKSFRKKNLDEAGYESLPETVENLADGDLIENLDSAPIEPAARQSKHEGALSRIQHGLRNALPSRKTITRALSINRGSERRSKGSDKPDTRDSTGSESQYKPEESCEKTKI